MKIFIALATSASLVGCLNMPTPTNQITGVYVSPVKYENLDCQRLTIELEALARREGQLVAAQEQRVKTSQTQAVWTGYGQGDGIEANELASIRGEKEAVQKQSALKACKT